MKNYKLMTALCVGIVLTFSACEDDDDEVTTPAAAVVAAAADNIATIAIADNRTDSLVVALSLTNLVPTFQGAGTFTVFAPTNAAFRDLLASNTNWNRISDIDNATLKSVLEYHVLGSVVRAADINNYDYAATLNNQGTSSNENTVIGFNVGATVTLNDDATVTQANIEASNGVIHIIDAVITPKNIVELAVRDERFTTLVSALQVFGDTLTSTLSGTGPFTVFAPTNDAFQDLLDSDSTWNSLSDIPRETLRTVLEYHVTTAGNVRAAGLSQGQKVPTLGGDELTVDLSNGAQLMTNNMNQGNVNIIVTDVQGTNGVIHAVDAVLLP